MSELPITESQPEKRKPGRPPGSGRKPDAKNPDAVAQVFAPTPVTDNDWNPAWENFGGDLDAIASIPKGYKLADRRDFGESLPSLQQKGVFICRADPTLQFNWKWAEQDGSRHVNNVLRGARQRGYRVATKEEFALNPNLRDIIVPDSTGRYVVPDFSGKSASIVLVRGKDAWQRDRDETLRFSNEIQVSASERAAAMQETLRQGGINAKVGFDVEETDKF